MSPTSRLRVLLNVQAAAGQKSGLGSYVEGLRAGFAELADAPEVVLASRPQPRDLSTPQRFLWDQIGFLGKIRQNLGRFDLIHQPAFSAPILTRLLTKAPIVVTIHDVIPMLTPENHSLPSRLFFNKWMPFSYRFAQAFLTVSECSKRDIIEHLHIPAEKIHVTPLAPATMFKPKTGKRISELRTKFGIGDAPYFLHIATLEPRKNLPFLIEAFAGLADKTSKLVISGKKGWAMEPIAAAVVAHNLQDRVIFTGYLDADDLPYLMSGAVAFVFPSLYEGFGLPPLEAMACGTPVIASNRSSLPEVVGEAGILIDPTTAKAWQDAMQTLLTQPAERERLAKAALVQAAQFSWRRTAEQTMQVYKSVARR